MSRQLRPRKGRPNYLEPDKSDVGDDQNQAGPSAISHVYEGSEGVFEADTLSEKVEEEILEEDDEEPAEALETKRKKGKPSSRGKGKSAASRSESAPRSSKRLSYSLPAPLVHHRHRAVPLLTRPGRVERLTEHPKLFGASSVTLTNGFAKIPRIMDRVTKSWGYNVGPGPLWELIEDRGWFKEAEVTGNGVDSEAKRRPRVYQDIRVREGWQLLTEK
jgi:transcription factor C subunit 6